ncbi:hypothetical protein DHODJN_14775 [Methylorubrum extorquens]
MPFLTPTGRGDHYLHRAAALHGADYADEPATIPQTCELIASSRRFLTVSRRLLAPEPVVADTRGTRGVLCWKPIRDCWKPFRDRLTVAPQAGASRILGTGVPSSEQEAGAPSATEHVRRLNFRPTGEDMLPEPDLRSDDVDGFRLHVCRRLVAALGRTEEDNIDHAYAPYEISAGQDAFDALRARFLAYLTGNWDGMARSYGRLEDDASRKLFVDLLLFRVLGCRHVRLDSNTPAYWEGRRQAEALPVEPSSFADIPGGAYLHHFLLPHKERTLRLGCLQANIFFTFLLRQYFFDRDGVNIQPEAGDNVVDAGACFGDTAVGFAEAVGETGHVYSFDPLAAHQQIVRHNIKQNNLSNTTVFSHGRCSTASPRPAVLARPKSSSSARSQTHSRIRAPLRRYNAGVRTSASYAARSSTRATMSSQRERKAVTQSGSKCRPASAST